MKTILISAIMCWSTFGCEGYGVFTHIDAVVPDERCLVVPFKTDLPPSRRRKFSRGKWLSKKDMRGFRSGRRR